MRRDPRDRSGPGRAAAGPGRRDGGRTGGLTGDRSGGAAVEFALVAPVLVALVLAGFVLGFGLWTRNALQQAASEAARCLAIGATACTVADGACASGDAGFCFLAGLAVKRGVRGLAAEHVTTSPAARLGGASFTVVSVAYPFGVPGGKVVLRAAGHFPNPP